MTPILVSYSGEQNSSLQGLVWTTTYEDTGLVGGGAVTVCWEPCRHVRVTQITESLFLSIPSK